MCPDHSTVVTTLSDHFGECPRTGAAWARGADVSGLTTAPLVPARPHSRASSPIWEASANRRPPIVHLTGDRLNRMEIPARAQPSRGERTHAGCDIVPSSRKGSTYVAESRAQSAPDTPRIGAPGRRRGDHASGGGGASDLRGGRPSPQGGRHRPRFCVAQRGRRASGLPRPPRQGTARHHLLPRSVVTLLQCRAGGSTSDPAGAHGAGRLTRGDLSTIAGAQSGADPHASSHV